MAPQVPDKTFDDDKPSRQSTSQDSSEKCPFCRIATLYAPYNPASPPSSSSQTLSPELTSPGPETYVLLSTPVVIAFLDIMPLSRGHLLLCTRRHVPKLTGTKPAEARELGYYLRVLSAAVSRATGVEDWNVVQNNGAAAAQVVPHMHYHIIPRPEIRAQGRWSEKFTMFGRGQRSDLEPEDGEKLAQRVREEVVRILQQDEKSIAKEKL
ncbi:HIT-like protein [Cryphonectria parasitica EP155]|uniref:HIT-like protein n=1 Tax=Cryphonectria parasitica (strain ATCC 38755 / EP155) TaxID=660469 RepID=A0A9P5CQX3_CRYP1|nr:HIT-like protein [Cryphonectria parasitica EP155]KAF3766922.1 HIT-like protein [Cryphonectria parasitica EP155]